MFGWIKKLFAKKEPASPPAASTGPVTAEEKPLGVLDVVDAFFVQNPQPTPFSVHALIAAGVTRLESDTQVLAACDKIKEHGVQYPLSPTLYDRMHKSGRLLEFLRWQARSEIGVEEYEHEMKIVGLIDRFDAQR